MTDQNAELLRLLETEEAQTAKISSEVVILSLIPFVITTKKLYISPFTLPFLLI